MNSSSSEWAELITTSDFTLDRAALLIAKTLQYPSLNVEAYLEKLDSMGKELHDLIGTKKRPTEIIDSVNDYLFEEQKFTGNSEDYYDPRNSYLNDVIERKTGIPITMSVLYMELARRAGFHLDGVGFPGHFLVKHTYHDIAIIIDPFNKGRILSQEELQRVLDQLYNGQVRLEQRFLESVTRDQILLRMLRNLKDTYLHSYGHEQALSATNMIISIDGNLTEEFRDRGLILYQKKLYGEALSDLTRYLEMQPEAVDADDIFRIIRNIQLLLRNEMYR